MIDLVSNLTQSQKAKQNENIIDLSQLVNNNNINNANPNNAVINDVKISNEPQQSKKIVDLEELLKSAYSNNNNNNNFQGNPLTDNYINNVSIIASCYQMNKILFIYLFFTKNICFNFFKFLTKFLIINLMN